SDFSQPIGNLFARQIHLSGFPQMESNAHVIARATRQPSIAGITGSPVKPGDDTKEATIANRLCFAGMRSKVFTHAARVCPPPSRCANDRAASGCVSRRGT